MYSIASGFAYNYIGLIRPTYILYSIFSLDLFLRNVALGELCVGIHDTLEAIVVVYPPPFFKGRQSTPYRTPVAPQNGKTNDRTCFAGGNKTRLTTHCHR